VVRATTAHMQTHKTQMQTHKTHLNIIKIHRTFIGASETSGRHPLQESTSWRRPHPPCRTRPTPPPPASCVMWRHCNSPPKTGCRLSPLH